MRRDTDRRGSIHMHAMDAMCSVMCGYGMQYVVVYSCTCNAISTLQRLNRVQFRVKIN